MAMHGTGEQEWAKLTVAIRSACISPLHSVVDGAAPLITCNHAGCRAHVKECRPLFIPLYLHRVDHDNSLALQWI